MVAAVAVNNAILLPRSPRLALPSGLYITLKNTKHLIPVSLRALLVSYLLHFAQFQVRFLEQRTLITPSVIAPYSPCNIGLVYHQYYLFNLRWSTTTASLTRNVGSCMKLFSASVSLFIIWITVSGVGARAICHSTR